MSSLWRRRRGKREVPDEKNSGKELSIPTHFRCPISLDLMKDPVSLSTGITYDRESIDKWLDAGHSTCPVTNQALRNPEQIPNHALRKMIQDWCVANKSHGVERIPTPRVPITPYDVSELCARITAAAAGRDEGRCRRLVTEIKNSAKESDRNRRCLVKHGIGAALAETWEAFARLSLEKHAVLIKEILSALTWSFPIGEGGVAKLRSPASLRCMAVLLKGDDLSSRRNAILVLKEVVISGDGVVVLEIEGIEEILVKTVKVPICPRATQACLVVIHHLLVSKKMGLRLVELGLVAVVVEMLVDGSKGVCEKALAVLDEICGGEEGRESACRNALTIPILVKKILRVSDRATALCVSSLWKLCLGLGGSEGGLVEALEVGGFQKLLVVLQLGCSDKTKEKVSELLKFMNVCKNKVECIDSSMGLKYVKRPTR